MPITVVETSMNDQKIVKPASPPWAVGGWPPLLWQLGNNNSLPLQHLCTQVNPSTDPSFRSAGQTVWAADCQDGRAAMAWDWVELSQGVFALADPMAIVTNLRLVDDSGEALPALQSALHINGIVHGLPWQQAVEHAVVAPAKPAAAPAGWFVPRRPASPRAAGAH
jgi:hypothetical protein